MKTAKAVKIAPPAPKRRKSALVVAGPDPDEIQDDASDIVLPDMADLEVEAKLGVFHEKFGDKDYKVRVELFNRDDNEFEIVDTVKLDGFDPFGSLKKYGGGRYRLSLLDESGKYVAGGRMETRIAKIAGEEKSLPPAPDNGMNAIVQMLNAQNAQNIELLKAMIGRPVPEQKGPSLTELIAALSGIKALSPKEESGMGGIKGTLELMKLVKEIMPAPAESESDGGVMDEVTKAVELFQKVGPALAAKRAPATRVSAAPVQNPAGGAPVMPAGTVIVESNPPEPESPMKPVLDKARSYVPQLTAWAARGKDIEEAADFILEEIEVEIVPLIVKNYHPGGITLSADFVFDQLIAKAKDPAQVGAIFDVVPELAAQRAWVERVIAKAVEFATAPAQDEAAPAENDSHGS